MNKVATLAEIRPTSAIDQPDSKVAAREAFDIDTDASEEALGQLVELTDKYCVVFQTIQSRPNTSVKIRRARH